MPTAMSRRSTFRSALLLLASALVWDSGSAWAQDTQEDLGQRLYAAAQICDLETVRSTVAQGANVNYLGQTLSGAAQTPLQAAIVGLSCFEEGSQVPVVEFLLGHHAAIDDPVAGSALQAALTARRDYGQGTDQIRVVQMLLDRGADVKARVRLSDGSTSTLLHTAVFFNAIESIKLLIDRGIDVNEMDSRGETALASLNDSDAVLLDSEKKKELARILKKAGAR